MIKTLLIAGAGGFVGTICRALVQKMSVNIYAGGFPLGTFLVNVTGCLLIGILTGWLERKGGISSMQTAFLVTGFCGGFTTFSTFENDMYGLVESQTWHFTILYPLLSIVVGFIFVFLGRYLMRI